ncbi:hypothetical protein NBV64_05875 [Alcaligenes sp. DN25]|uniref:hypothetical protein n=1 Tax=Alcaligenes TaxID=507 RepID=UPI0020308C56|nr:MULTISPECIES: hypothetical protein [Alcaligenes]URW83880.1 hypothetical protein NBV64_05875 [Alcaligenes sp. DN25]WEA68718.1 hypothetical protein PWH35_05885 [Alcaligenes faecalis]
MKLRSQDEALTKEVARGLRAVYAENASSALLAGVEEMDGDFSVQDDTPSVKITKEDLRKETGRKVIRDSLIDELAAHLNREVGVAAMVRDGVLYARAVPHVEMEANAISLTQLKIRKTDAVQSLKEDDEEEK